MGHYPLGTGNYVLICLGVFLTALGPYIVYRTVRDLRKHFSSKQSPQPSTANTLFNFAINLVIAFLLFSGGILFVLNNLRGNEFA